LVGLIVQVATPLLFVTALHSFVVPVVNAIRLARQRGTARARQRCGHRAETDRRRRRCLNDLRRTGQAGWLPS
jgi:hypothetical protein